MTQKFDQDPRQILFEFFRDKVVGFQASILLKVSFCRFTFQEIVQLFKNTYLKECIFMAVSAIYFFKLFLLSGKQVRKSIGQLRKFQNFLQRTFKLFGLIMTMVILYMTEDKTFLFIRKQIHFSIMLPQQSQIPKGELSNISSIRRWYRRFCCFVKIQNSKSPVLLQVNSDT